MNTPEFNRWWADFRDRFPSKAAWVGNRDNPALTLTTWRQTLNDVDLSDALAASISLQQRGTIENVWDGIPAAIRSEAQVQHVRRQTSSDTIVERFEAWRYRTVQTMRKAGKTQEEIDNWVDSVQNKIGVR